MGTKINNKTRESHDSARTRRRERRKEERHSKENSKKRNRGPQKNQNKKSEGRSNTIREQRKRSESIDSNDSGLSGTYSTDSTNSMTSSESIRPLHEKITSKRGKKVNRNSQKKKTPKKTKKTKPQMELEILSDVEKEKYVALDCEMVGVGYLGRRSALARVSIVNWDGDVVLDKYVKVDEPVTDFRTFVSGVTQSDIESDDAMDLYECRAVVHNILKDKVVVGHALKNDFYALRLHHPWYMTRDSARYDPFMKADPMYPGILRPRKLKELAKNKLGLVIQEEGKQHDSIEDARAAMELYKKARRKWDMAIEWKWNKTRDIQLQEEQMMECIEFIDKEQQQMLLSAGVSTLDMNCDQWQHEQQQLLLCAEQEGKVLETLSHSVVVYT